MLDNIVLPGKVSLNDMSWQGIKSIAAAGKAAEYWKPGDTKTIVLDGKASGMFFNQFAIDCFILGIDHNPDIEGKNHIHFGIGMKNGLPIGLCDYLYRKANKRSDWPMNISKTPTGWKDCYMRNDVLGNDADPVFPPKKTFLSLLPRALREVMCPITKYTDNASFSTRGSREVTPTKDLLWLLAEYEMYGKPQNANPYEHQKQAQYDYFKEHDKLIYQHDTTERTTNVWLRSGALWHIGCFCIARYDGEVGICSTTSLAGDCAAFICFAV